MKAAPADRRDGGAVEVELDGRVLRLSSLDKVLWPQAGFTKADMIDFYARAAPALLAHIAGRPLTLRRFPDGIAGLNWYQTQCPRGHPSWVRTQALPNRRGGAHSFCLVNDLPSLVWAANLGSIELHPLLAHGERPDEPAALVFDLDPGAPADVLDCCRVAIWIRDLLAGLGLASFAKTSGSVGLHVHVPLNSPHSYGATKAFARALAQRLTAERPDLVVDNSKRSLRRGKVLVDWLQNNRTRSTVAAYSLRAMPWPTVSTPVSWDEIEAALAANRAELLTFEPADVLRRLDRLGDLFRPVLELEQTLAPFRQS